MASVYELLEGKIVTTGEVTVSLFEHCNLSCTFCPQDHSSMVGASLEEMLFKANRITEWINLNGRTTRFRINVMGGELFQDRFVKDGFLEKYQAFINFIKNNILPSKQVSFNFITNLVFNDVKPVIDFLEFNDFMISVSYDSRGRFNKQQLEVYKNNIEIFKPYISCICSIITKHSIDALLEGDQYFSYLYDNFPIYWDTYMPSTQSAQKLMPKQSDMLKFYKYLIDYYPKCSNIDHFVNKKPANKMMCTRGNNFTIFANNVEPVGCSGTYHIRDSNVEDFKSEKVVSNFLDKYNCFKCPYFARCPLTCFVKSSYKYIEHDLDECVYKLTFDYADGKDKDSIC